MVTTQTASALLLALVLDRLLEEPRRWHPLVGFGRVATRLEQRLHPGRPESRLSGRLRGAAAWLLLVALPVALLAFALPQAPWRWLPEGVLLYLTVGGESLTRHGLAVVEALGRSDLVTARSRAGWLVSRETGALDAGRVAGATVESVLENGCDALFGALFWFLLAGAPGAVAYRLANTLDAMWGYKTLRHRHFGWAAARADDLLNLIPARLTALTYALSGRTAGALRCWWRQAGAWKSPNAGAVMASGAGALGVLLGGMARYHGVDTPRPALGEGADPEPRTILEAIALVRRGTILWCGVVVLLWGIGHD